jgi:hypothetical protein
VTNFSQKIGFPPPFGGIEGGLYWGGLFLTFFLPKKNFTMENSEVKMRGEKIKKFTIVAMRSVAALIITAIGIFFIIYKNSFGEYEPHLIQIFGIGCIVYGAFRMWRAYNDYQAPIEEDEE